jgi:hypothetical protein
MVVFMHTIKIKRTKEKQEGVAHKPAYLYTYDN